MTINRPHPSPVVTSATLPRSLQAPSRLGANQPSRAPNVLVVQPDRTIRTVAISALQTGGYRGIGVARGDEALFMLLERHFDAVLLGVQLPGIAARELCLRLRAMDSHATTPVLYLLHPNEQPQMEGLFAAGGDDFLTLPLSAELLRTRLAGRLQRGAAQKRISHEQGELAWTAGREEPGVGAGVMVVRSWVPRALGMDSSVSGLGSRSVASQLGLQVECIYRHGGRVERLTDGMVFALFDGPTGIFDAGQCSESILALGAGLSSNPEERPGVALGIVGFSASPGEGADGSRESLLDAAFAAALDHCRSARAMQVVVPPELQNILGGLAHVRYARIGSVSGLIQDTLKVPVRKVRRAREHAA